MTGPDLPSTVLWDELPEISGNAFGDLDADGAPDLVVVAEDPSAYWWCDLTSGTARPYLGSSGAAPLDSAPFFTDVTGDGWKDLVFSQLAEDGSYGLVIAPARVGAPPVPEAPIPLGSSRPYVRGTGDADGDGRGDVLIDNQVWLGRSEPPYVEFSHTYALPTSNGEWPWGGDPGTWVGDLDEDGWEEFLVPDWTTTEDFVGTHYVGGAWLHHGVTSGAETQPPTYVPPTREDEGIGREGTIADLDGDGVRELVALSATWASGYAGRSAIDGAITSYVVEPSVVEGAEFRFEYVDPDLHRLTDGGTVADGRSRVVWSLEQEARVLEHQGGTLVVVQTVIPPGRDYFGGVGAADLDGDPTSDLTATFYGHDDFVPRIVGWPSTDALFGCTGGIDPTWVPAPPPDDDPVVPDLPGSSSDPKGCGCRSGPSTVGWAGILMVGLVGPRRRRLSRRSG